MPLHFSSKDFEILDIDPPNNPTSHYSACHFGYSVALKLVDFMPNSYVKKDFSFNVNFSVYGDEKANMLF